jgi:ATP-dependent RNA helicase DDX24/MAK5
MSWKPVTVELGGGGDSDETKNHYDDEKLSRKAKRDLPVNPGEPVGMFYGLEVCHDYNIKGLSSEQTTKETPLETVSTKKRKQKDAPEEHRPSEDPSTESAEKGEDETKKKNKKKKTKKSESKLASEDPPTEIAEKREDETNEKSKKKKTKKESKLASLKEAEQKKAEVTAEEPIDQDRYKVLQQAWGHVLEPELTESLYRSNFFQPTPIQAETLNAAILGRRNIVGAAPTGSGKTLAFILPILNHIIQAEKAEKKTMSPQAVIVTPTRELATQIQEECNKLLPNQCVTLVGGIAAVKQARLLQTKRAPIIIGTPGRLWAMVRIAVCTFHL